MATKNGQQTPTSWKPTQKQAAVLEAAQQAGPNRTISAVCKTAGVSRPVFYEWLNTNDDFRAAWDEVWQIAIRRHLPPVVLSMLHQASRGNVAAARLIAEMAGALKQRVEHTGRVAQVHEGTVLVVGGDEVSYVEALRKVRDGDEQVVQ